MTINMIPIYGVSACLVGAMIMYLGFCGLGKAEGAPTYEKDIHRAVSKFGIIYGVLILLVGICATILATN